MAKNTGPLAAVGAFFVSAFEYVRDLDVVESRDESLAATAHYRVRHPMPNHTLQLHTTSARDGDEQPGRQPDEQPVARYEAPTLTRQRPHGAAMKVPMSVIASDEASLQRARRFRTRLELLRGPGTLRLVDPHDTQRRRHG